MLTYFTPNSLPKNKWIPILGTVVVVLGLWQVLKPTVFPGPIDVILAVPGLVTDGFISDLWASAEANFEALILSALVGLPIAYLCRVPVVTPFAEFLAKLRFVGSAVFYLPLLLVLPTGHEVKVGLLALGELFYLVTTMMGVVINLPDYQFDDARTLRMSEWLSVWYVVIRGTVAEAIQAIRDNAGMGWSMLMFVEGVVRSEGGVGVLILNAEKHVNYDHFFAVVLLVVLFGIGQDWIFGLIKKAACPYA